MNEWIIAAIATVVLLGIAKFFPREKLVLMTIPWSGFAAKWLDKLLLQHLPAKTAEDVEEGIICTIVYVIRKNLDCFEDNLLKNNKKYMELKSK